MTPESQTYAVPLALMALLVLLGAAALGYLYYRKRRLQLAVVTRPVRLGVSEPESLRA